MPNAPTKDELGRKSVSAVVKKYDAKGGTIFSTQQFLAVWPYDKYTQAQLVEGLEHARSQNWLEEIESGHFKLTEAGLAAANS